MAQPYDQELKGAMFVNDRKESEKHPDFRGTVTVEGIEYWCDGWKNVAKQSGKKFIALRLRKKDEQPRAAQPQAAAGSDSW